MNWAVAHKSWCFSVKAVSRKKVLSGFFAITGSQKSPPSIASWLTFPNIRFISQMKYFGFWDGCKLQFNNIWKAIQYLHQHCVCQQYMQICFTNKGNFQTHELLVFWGVWEAELLHYRLSFYSRGNIVEILAGILPPPNVSLLQLEGKVVFPHPPQSCLLLLPICLPIWHTVVSQGLYTYFVSLQNNCY